MALPVRRLLGGLALAAALFAATAADAQLTMRVAVPGDTPGDAAVFVAGSFNGWNPGDPAYRLRPADGGFVITLPDAVRGPVEFKFTRGSWDAVETDSAGGSVANRAFTIPAAGAATYEGRVAAWQDPAKVRPKPHTATASVTVIDTAFRIPQLGRMRRVWVYLPPGYASSHRRYPVLYMQDGQNVFDAATSGFGEWAVDESLDSLRALGDPGVIVVAVDHGGSKRLDEYSPWRNARYGGGEGEAYADFLARTLKPYVDRRFRTLADPAHTAVMGSSMGGLISLYAILKYPEVFGRAGVFSPSLWFSPDVYALARAAHPRAGSRIYLLMGGREGDTPEQAVQDARRMADTLAAAGLRPGAQLVTRVAADGQHSEWFWRREFPAAYLWLFGRAGHASSRRAVTSSRRPTRP